MRENSSKASAKLIEMTLGTEPTLHAVIKMFAMRDVFLT